VSVCVCARVYAFVCATVRPPLCARQFDQHDEEEREERKTRNMKESVAKNRKASNAREEGRLSLSHNHGNERIKQVRPNSYL